MNDRSQRIKNIIIFNLKENINSENKIDLTADKFALTDKGNIINYHNKDHIKFHGQLGKLNTIDPRNRLLKVIFDFTKLFWAHKKSTNVNQLLTQCNILRDRTMKHIEGYQAIKQQLQTRLSQREQRLKIVSYGDDVKIVKSKKPQSHLYLDHTTYL